MRAIITKNSNYLVLIRDNGFCPYPHYDEGLAAFLTPNREIICYTTAEEYHHLLNNKSVELPYELNIHPNKFTFKKMIEHYIYYEESDEHSFSGHAYECPLTHRVTACVDSESWHGYPGCPGSTSLSSPMYRNFDNVKEFNRYYDNYYSDQIDS